MNILAIDTTTKKANVAVEINDKVKTNSIDNEITHSEKLLPLIDSTLKECNITIKDIDVLACTTGPGSFTGIRIGLSTVKALSKVTGAKIFCIDSLKLLAHCVDTKNYTLVVPLIDAKHNRAYANIFLKNEDDLQSTILPENKYLDDILKDVENFCYTNKIDAKNVLLIADSLDIKSYISDKYDCMLASLNMNELVRLATLSQDFTNYLNLDATYVRSSEAERTKYGE